MIKFTRLLEEIENGRFFKVNVELELILMADNEGDAGYTADSILSIIENQSNYQIINIEQTDERITEKIKIKKNEEEEILLAWNKKFGDSIVDKQDSIEFYHEMREKGHDGMLIFQALGNKIQ